MHQFIFLFLLGLIWIIFAVVQDIRRREIADWLNISLVIFALGFRFFYSLFSQEDFSFFYQGLIGFGLFFLLGNLFYYSRMFAGGDAKLMIALGAVLPIYPSLFQNFIICINFIFIFMIVSLIYILGSSLLLSAGHFSQFKKEFFRQLIQKKRFIIASLISGFFLFLLGLFNYFFFILSGLILLIPLLFIYSKAIDEACLVNQISSGKLREGDWLYQDLKKGKFAVKTKWGGLSKEEIKQIRKHFSSVKIREGIPFSPVFLISFALLSLLLFLGIKLWNPFW